MNIFDKRPLFTIIIALISGFVGFTFGDGIVRGLLLLCAVLSLVLSLIFYFKGKIKSLLFIIIPVALLLSMILSYLYFDVHFKLYEQYDQEVEIEGKIISLEKGSFSSQIIVKTEKINQINKRGYKVRLDIPNYSLGEEFIVGTKVLFYARLSEFKDFSDLDANSYYFADGISADATEVRDLTYIGKGKIPLLAHADYLRSMVLMRAETMADNKASSLFFALFLGEREMLDDQIKLDFKRLGITHILALSGLHLSIISLGLSKALSVLRVKKKARLIIVSFFIFAYMILTGLSVSVVRAGIMILLSSALFLVGKTKDSPTSLSIAVLVILIVTPYAVYDLALWLSALSTLGIVAMGDLEEVYSPDKKSILRKAGEAILSSFKASLFATSATLLVTVFAFGALSLASAVATFVFSILAEMIIYVGMLMLIFGNIIPIGFLLNLVSSATYYLANVMARPDWIYLSSDHVIIMIVTIAYTVGFLLFLSLCLKNKRTASIILASSFVLVMLTSLTANLVCASDDIAIYNADDDGDRIILRSNSKVALINSASQSTSSAYQGYELLSNEKITYLNMYYLTGYSSSLVNDVTKMISLIKVDTVYLPCPDSEKERVLLEDLSYELENRSTDICLYEQNESVIWNEYKICSLHRTLYGSSKPKTAFSISKGDKNILYLSAGMMHGTEKILAFGMIAESDAVIFGRKDHKKYNKVTFDVYNENIKSIYIAHERIDIQMAVAAEYKNSGTEIYRDATTYSLD